MEILKGYYCQCIIKELLKDDIFLYISEERK